MTDTTNTDTEQLKSELSALRRENKALHALREYKASGLPELTTGADKLILNELGRTLADDTPPFQAEQKVRDIIKENPFMLAEQGKKPAAATAYNPRDLAGTTEQRQAAIAKRFKLA